MLLPSLFPGVAIVPFLTLVPLISAQYFLLDDYAPASFINLFDFYTGSDPSNGFVQYVNKSTAISQGLVSTFSDHVYVGADYKNVYPTSGRGRPSVRLISRRIYNHGLFLLDLSHMPFGCGTWPAFWTLGPSWPSYGEIDIIEGVNLNSRNLVSMHTSDGCTVAGANQTGTLETSNCYIQAGQNAGCGGYAPSNNSYGAGLNAAGGGIYAMEWTSSFIRVWFFPRGDIPASITAGAPDVSQFGVPIENFQGSCDIDTHFGSHHIIFTLTFCGDYAGNTYGSSGCPLTSGLNGYDSCKAFVGNNYEYFSNAYWNISSLRVYQQPDLPDATLTSSTSLSSITPVASTASISPIPGGMGAMTNSTSFESLTVSIPSSASQPSYIGYSFLSSLPYEPVLQGTSSITPTDLVMDSSTSSMSSSSGMVASSSSLTITSSTTSAIASLISSSRSGLIASSSSLTITSSTTSATASLVFSSRSGLAASSRSLTITNGTLTITNSTTSAIGSLISSSSSSATSSGSSTSAGSTVTVTSTTVCATCSIPHATGPSYTGPPASLCYTCALTPTLVLSSDVGRSGSYTGGQSVSVSGASGTCSRRPQGTVTVWISQTVTMCPTPLVCPNIASQARGILSVSGGPGGASGGNAGLTTTSFGSESASALASGAGYGQASSTTSVAPGSSAMPACPGTAGGTIFNSPMGMQYSIQCGTYASGTAVGYQTNMTLATCISACDMYNTRQYFSTSRCTAIIFYEDGRQQNCDLIRSGGTSSVRSDTDSAMLLAPPAPGSNGTASIFPTGAIYGSMTASGAYGGTSGTASGSAGGSGGSGSGGSGGFGIGGSGFGTLGGGTGSGIGSGMGSGIGTGTGAGAGGGAGGSGGGNGGIVSTAPGSVITSISYIVSTSVSNGQTILTTYGTVTVTVTYAYTTTVSGRTVTVTTATISISTVPGPTRTQTNTATLVTTAVSVSVSQGPGQTVTGPGQTVTAAAGGGGGSGGSGGGVVTVTASGGGGGSGIVTVTAPGQTVTASGGGGVGSGGSGGGVVTVTASGGGGGIVTVTASGGGGSGGVVTVTQVVTVTTSSSSSSSFFCRTVATNFNRPTKRSVLWPRQEDRERDLLEVLMGGPVKPQPSSLPKPW